MARSLQANPPERCENGQALLGAPAALAIPGVGNTRRKPRRAGPCLRGFAIGGRGRLAVSGPRVAHFRGAAGSRLSTRAVCVLATFHFHLSCGSPLMITRPRAGLRAPGPGWPFALAIPESFATHHWQGCHRPPNHGAPVFQRRTATACYIIHATPNSTECCNCRARR